MKRAIDQKFMEWTGGRSEVESRISVFEKIRDIPYAVIPEINSAKSYSRMLTVRKGSCTPKHFLLRDMYERMGLPVLYVVYPFRWRDLEVDYPAHLRRLAEVMPVSYHLACKVEICGRLVLVDATVDRALKKLGLPVNENWNGYDEMVLPVTPVGEEQLFHPAEVRDYRARYDAASLEFFDRMNAWLERIREAG
ncbi:MAG: hypothetical protein QUS33_08435 [Dehalococcoidia bacterium]|nr:hypothetical protein [Dehalococcoidia bacterium]